jgi:hypothetical protein
MIRPVSDCHAASLEEAGRGVVRSWTCKECGEHCEAAVTDMVTPA